MRKENFVVIKRVDCDKYDVCLANKACTVIRAFILTCDTYEEAERIRKGLKEGTITL